MAKRVADLLVDVLSEAGVQRVYGGSGDSLDWIHERHEEAPAFAVGAEARILDRGTV